MTYFSHFFKKNTQHPKLAEADRVLLEHAISLRRDAEIISSRDKNTAIILLEHAIGLCDEVVRHASPRLIQMATQIKQACVLDIKKNPASYTSLSDFIAIPKI